MKTRDEGKDVWGNGRVDASLEESTGCFRGGIAADADADAQKTKTLMYIKDMVAPLCVTNRPLYLFDRTYIPEYQNGFARGSSL
jgi:hypothetical protein